MGQIGLPFRHDPAFGTHLRRRSPRHGRPGGLSTTEPRRCRPAHGRSTAPRSSRRRGNRSVLRRKRPEIIVFAAARVGGIAANQRGPIDFYVDNDRLALSAIPAAFRAGVRRFVYLASTCVYPRDCPQPIREESLLSGPLEWTNEAYALAKIGGLKLCSYYRRQAGVRFHTVVPTNLYGPGDNYHPEDSHVVAALIRRFHLAKVEDRDTVTIWGSGEPRREFLHVDDLADAVVHLMNVDEPPDWINAGTGIDHTVSELAALVAKIVGFEGRIVTDPTRPDGAPVKRTDVSRIHALGWRHRIDLAEGLRRTYDAFLREWHAGTLRGV